MHASEIFIKENFHNRTRYRPHCFSETLGVVKRICTHSSAARPSVKRQRKRPSDFLSLFSSLVLLLLAAAEKYPFRDYKSCISYVSNSSVIIHADRVDRRHFLGERGIWGRLRFRRCTRSREIEGCTAFRATSCFFSSARRVQYKNEQKRLRAREIVVTKKNDHYTAASYPRKLTARTTGMRIQGRQE